MLVIEPFGMQLNLNQRRTRKKFAEECPKCVKCEPPKFAGIQPPKETATFGVTKLTKPANFAGLKKTLIYCLQIPAQGQTFMLLSFNPDTS